MEAILATRVGTRKSKEFAGLSDGGFRGVFRGGTASDHERIMNHGALATRSTEQSTARQCIRDSQIRGFATLTAIADQYALEPK